MAAQIDLAVRAVPGEGKAAEAVDGSFAESLVAAKGARRAPVEEDEAEVKPLDGAVEREALALVAVLPQVPVAAEALPMQPSLEVGGLVARGVAGEKKGAESVGSMSFGGGSGGVFGGFGAHASRSGAAADSKPGTVAVSGAEEETFPTVVEVESPSAVPGKLEPGEGRVRPEESAAEVRAAEPGAAEGQAAAVGSAEVSAAKVGEAGGGSSVEVVSRDVPAAVGGGAGGNVELGTALVKAAGGKVGGLAMGSGPELGKAVSSLAGRGKVAGRFGGKEGGGLKEVEKFAVGSTGVADAELGQRARGDNAAAGHGAAGGVEAGNRQAVVEVQGQSAAVVVSPPSVPGGGERVEHAAGEGLAAAQDLAGARPVAEAQGLAGAQALPAMHTARLIQSIGQTEMRVGLRSAEFGNISIRTSSTPELMSAQISVDHGDLARMLASHVPEMQARLGGGQPVHVQIDLSGQGHGGGERDRNGSRQEGESSNRREEGQGSRGTDAGRVLTYAAVRQAAVLSHDVQGRRLDVRV